MSRSFVRFVSAFLAVIILLEVSPVAVRAESPATVTPATSRAFVNAQLANLAAQLQGDLKLLNEKGKEAFLDVLFARLDADQARVEQVVVNAVHSTGAKPLGMSILRLGSSVLANVLSVVPESWQESIVISTLHKFIGKTLREVRSSVAGLPRETLAKGLQSLHKLVTDPRFANGQAMTGDTWWEKFFGNSTIVKNFLIVVVTLASIGVAVVLAIAGSTAAPIVAVVGALVALIALISTNTLV